MRAALRTLGTLALVVAVAVAGFGPTPASGPGPSTAAGSTPEGGTGQPGPTTTDAPDGEPSATPAEGGGPGGGPSGPSNATSGSGSDGPPDDDRGEHDGPPNDAGPPGQDGPGGSNVTGPPVGACDAGRSVPDVARRPDGAGGPPCTRNRTRDASVPANASALALRLQAFRRLSDANLTGDEGAGTEQVRRELRARLNRTFDAFFDANRVTDSAVFRADANVTAATIRRAPTVATLLIAADERLARQAIADAERVRRQLQRRNRTFDEAAVAAELQEARRAIQRAEHVRERSPAPVAATVHYRRAWSRAQRALDLLDRATTPDVAVTRRADPVRTGPANYTVEGTVLAVRPRLLGNVTVAVGNRTYETVPGGRVGRNETPGSAVSFAVRVRLPARVTTVTVTVRDATESVSPLSGDDGTPAGSELGRARLRLDGDGLPDRYERRVATTGPLDPDSDAATTSPNESDDGRIDGRIDLDGDALVTASERGLGTDPLASDTDGDGLADSYEAGVTGTDPTVADTDGDGVVDGREDPDGDGLSNAREVAVGSAPARADTDGDGLDDAAELDAGTDPTARDTDGDGLADATELEEPFGTDPTDPDTDDDGVPDGAEPVTTTTANRSLGARVTATGPGASVADVTVRSGSRPAFDGGLVETVGVSTPVAVEAGGTVESATVTLSYDGSRASDVENESALTVARMDVEHQRLVPVPTTVTAAENVATARVTEFSTFVVVSPAALADLPPVPSRWSRQFDLDSLSGWTCEGTCAVTDGVAVVAGSSGDVSPEHVCIRHVEPCLGTPVPTETATPTSTATPTPTDEPDDGGPSGGDGDEGSLPPGDGEDVSTLTRTVSFGGSVERAAVEVRVLADVPEDGPGGVQVAVRHDGGTATLLTGGTAGDFETIEVVVEDPGDAVTVEVVASGDATVALDRVRVAPDSDGDGLADPREQVDCLPTLLFGCVGTDVSIPDSDGDGLADGGEVDAVRNETLDFGRFGTVAFEYVTLTSRPDVADTDGDGLSDGTEVDGWQIPVQQSSLASLGDEATVDRRPIRYDPSSAMTMHLDSNPLADDTDGDGLTDAEERFATKTDPRRQVTYRVTDLRQRDVVNRFADLYQAFEANDRVSSRTVLEAAIAYGLLDADATGEDLLSLELTDATDDFDLVGVEDGTFGFRALDDRQRTDTWLSNVEELRGQYRTDMFDPDTDDDGLTDGQEEKGVTRTVTVALSDREFNTVTLPTKDETITTQTDPTDPDTDGDGVWDGWLGVHGVGHSENVVLYMEHLESGDGLVGDELVVEQAGIHRVSPRAPARTSAVIDGERVHSNIHVGELHWGTNPRDDGDLPDRSLTVEVDYYPRGGTAALDNQEWERGIERNFALYGFPVDVVRDEKLPRRSQLEDGIDLEEMAIIDERHRSTGADEYLLVVHEYTGPDSDAAIAANVPGTTRQFIAMDQVQGEAVTIPTNQVEKTPYSNATTVFGVAVELHETGHAFDFGRADDGEGEVYSGSDKDLTVERLSGLEREWSIMARQWSDEFLGPPMNGRYFAISLEELSTAGTDDS